MEKPIDHEAIRRIEAQLERVLQEYPELLEANPERQKALEEWLAALDRKEVDHGV